MHVTKKTLFGSNINAAPRDCNQLIVGPRSDSWKVLRETYGERFLCAREAKVFINVFRRAFPMMSDPNKTLPHKFASNVSAILSYYRRCDATSFLE